MFITGKPIRFGYKVWMLCSSDGYPHQADIYCGKSDRPKNRGLGEHVILKFAEMIPEKGNHELHFDNFFTSHSLLCQLREMGVRATGTAREGRIGGAKLPDKRYYRKADRGTFDYLCDGAVCIVRWSDNNVVTCATNFDSVHPVSLVERHVKGSVNKSKVHQPRMITNYMSGMGGVDLMDRLLSAYRPQIKSKKWWWNLFTNAINMAVVASWKLHSKAVGASSLISHIEFRREVVIGLLKSSGGKRMGGPTAPVSVCVRYDGVGHYIGPTTQGRCAECGKNT